jgi:YesN/AraC family two-component response regulator
MKALIAEDNPPIVNGNKRTFPAFNLEIIDIAVNGVEAVETYRKLANRIDLVFCDNNMPRMSGQESS